MIPIAAFFAIILVTLILIPFLKVRLKGIVTFLAVVLNAIITGYYAVLSLTGRTFLAELPGSLITGTIPLRLDALAGWFILIINLVFITGGFYGFFYLKAYKSQVRNLGLHAVCFVLQHASILCSVVVQNSIAFLIAWEMLALTSFLLIIFEREKETTIAAGLNYLVQSHFSFIFLVIGFIWVAQKTGSYDFNAVTAYANSLSPGASMLLFMIFFTGFAFKSGFVPFHTWLPHAHPAAPSHVSGMMSGVVIKAGIYGIFRMLLLIKTDYTTIGYIILGVSVISGLYGVMLAIVQHDLKKLLAYHSIENIGIIGLGIGIGCIGLGSGNYLIAMLGFAGALLHTLNHALFKSLLFYAAGIVYQATHTLNIEHLGGLIKKMPQTAVLFLIAAIAISGIPPFNGFISEFLIYSGLYYWLQEASLASLICCLFMIMGLVLIGGLALLCFTKAFGIVFLGSPRHEFQHEVREAPFMQLLPLYLIALLIVAIGLFPGPFLNLIMAPVSLFPGIQGALEGVPRENAAGIMQHISWAMWGLILLTSLILLVRKLAMQKREVTLDSTWGCGYVAPTAKQQYTASSFVKTYSQLNRATLSIRKHEKRIDGLYPGEAHYETHAYDQLEKWLIDKPLKGIETFMGWFRFFQNGRLQSYILYGIVFILAMIFLPMIFDSLSDFFDFLKCL